MSKKEKTQEYWQLTATTVLDRMIHLFANSTLTDCKFVVGVSSGKRTFKAHKLILAAASPVFEAMLFRHYNQSEKIEVVDLTPDSFYAMLDFLYTDDLHWVSLQNLFDIYRAAEKYIIPVLQEKCISLIEENLNESVHRPSVIMEIYELARTHDFFDIRDKCLNIMRENFKSYIISGDMLKISSNAMMDMLNFERNDISEVVVFKQLTAWAVSECYRQNYSPVTEKSMRKVILPMLSRVNFTSMTADEFVTNVTESNLLTDNESYRILRKIIKPNDKLEMPFSKLTVKTISELNSGANDSDSKANNKR